MIARIEALLRHNQAFVQEHLCLDPSSGRRPQTSMIDNEAAMPELCKFRHGVAA